MKKENQIKKQVCFNPEYDKELSTYVKKLIREDMKK